MLNLKMQLKKLLVVLPLLLLAVTLLVAALVLSRPTTLLPQAVGAVKLLVGPPAGTSLVTGQSVNAFVILDAGSQSLSAVDLVLTYDSTKLEVQDSDPAVPGVQVQPGNLFKTYLGNKADPCGNAGQSALLGKITLSGVAYDASKLPAKPPHDPFPAPGSSPVGTFAVINFKAIAPGSAPIKFQFVSGNTNDTNAVDVNAQEVLGRVIDSSFNITGQPITNPPNCSAPTPTLPLATPTLSPPSPTPTLPLITPTPILTPTPTLSPTPTATVIPTSTLIPTPTGCTEPDYDLDCDQIVCGRDASIFVSNFRVRSPYQCVSARPSCNPDFNNDAVVNGADASILMSNWSCR